MSKIIYYKIDRDLELPMGTTSKVVESLLDQNVVILNKSFDKSLSFITENIDEYRKFFSKRNCGLSRMGDKRSCIKLMAKFMSDNPNISWDDVIKAASNYIKERLNSDRPDLIARADNFIYFTKDGENYESRLLMYSEDINQRETYERRDIL